MLTLWPYTADRLARELHRIGQRDGADVYVVTVYVRSIPAEDPRRTVLEVRWDTETRHASRVTRASPASTPLDTRWATRHMVHGDHEIWDATQDPDGHDVLTRWCIEQGLRFHDDPEADDDDLTDEEILLKGDMVSGLIAVMRDLYSTGAVGEAFGRDIPVTLIPQDEHARFPEWNRQISPPEMYALFGPYYESIWSEG